ncbi:MAG: mechanosensitive ion channel family protein [Gemmatimonadota bacterium]|nr:MAG: mechanosensitive ion channel family protein [Gemmatimonadota bacterium]
MDILQTVVLGNSIQAWLIGSLATLAIFIALRFGIRTVHKRLAAIAERTTTRWDDVVAAVLGSTKAVFLLLFAAFFASLTVQLSQQVRGVVVSVAVLALLVQAGMWAGTALKVGLREYAEQQLSEDATALTTMNAIGWVARLVLWSVILLLALDNLGIDITALVTGLGIGGIAVALAAQNILGDLFASLMIVLDKPFVMKDFLIVNEFLGSVEHIGLKTTRLRSLSGEQLVFSNADLLNSRIRNYGRMFERRVVFSVGVVYQTPRDRLERIPDIIRTAIESQEKTRFDRAHFKEFGAYSLDFEAVYYVLDPAYNVYMDTQQAINFSIHERFEAEGIEFAYPSQTLFVVNEGSVPQAAGAN